MPESKPIDAPQQELPPFDLEGHVFYWMTQVTSRRDEQLAPALRKIGLRVPEWRCLGALHARGYCAMSELADVASIDRTTLSRNIDRMVKAGLIVRLTDGSDLRVVRVRLTSAGKQKFARAIRIVEALNRAAFENLPDGVVELLRWTLARMKENLDAHLPARGDGKASRVA